MTSTLDAPDPPALRRLAELDRRWTPVAGVGRRPTQMGYQPALDGLRAISVVAVMLFHAGFAWMSGGFFGVEVFFVVSGYLITALLLDEREQAHTVSLQQFWLRRARRLLPALFTMLATVAVWAALFASAEQQSTLRRDLPWSILYVGNWGQIVGETPYFAAADPPLLRHLWSLAVEEQWYLIWPLVFVAAMAIGAGHLRSRGAAFITAALGLMLTMTLLHGHVSDNALYLATFTRIGGLLLGAGCAFVWRPWRFPSPSQTRGRRLDPVGAAALTLLVCIMCVASLTAAYVYQWLLPLVSVLSMAVIAVIVYPTAYGMRAILGARPLVEVGRRSYGLYLWHWPIYVIGDVYHSGSWPRFLVATAVTVGVTELSYRFIETPIRKGAIGRWMREQRQSVGADREWRTRRTGGVLLGVGAAVVGLFVFYASVDHYDAAIGGADAAFVLPPVTDATGSTALPVTNVPVVTAPAAVESAPETVVATVPASTPEQAALPTTTVAATPTTLASLPRKVVVVGDSQAHSLAINLPDGIGDTFTITDGSVEGCGVYDTGKVISARSGFNRSFGDCGGWPEEWATAAARADADVALVVLGAWDVFDLQLADRTLVFGTPEADAHYLAQLQRGIDALKFAGTKVALMQVPCMRPQDVKGAGVPALPERGDDVRTQHVSDLLRQAAAADPANVVFIDGPPEWCNDEAISADLGYRWDGVHVYKPGANLIYTKVAPALLAIPVP